MNRLTALSLIAMIAIVSSCGNNKNKNMLASSSSSNPLLTESTLPYQAIPFDKIKDSDYQPAIEAGIKQRLEEIEKIANNPEAATFENTFVEMEKSGRLLSRANNAFDVVTGANTNPTLQKIQEEEAPKLKAADDAIYLNPKLFERVESIYNKRDQLSLDPESKRLVEYFYQKFILAGARLSPEKKDQLKKLNEEEASLRAKFTNQLLAADRKSVV